MPSPLRTQRASSSRRPSLLLGLALAALSLVAFAPRAFAGADDFEFGQRLAQKGYFPWARRVYQGMLDNPKAAEADKELARFGLATLGYEEARTAGYRAEVPFADVLKLYDTAADQIEAFAKKNPTHPKAKDAQLEAGRVRLQVVLWCRELLEKPDGLAARKTTPGEVAGAARAAVDAAVAHFQGLKSAPGELGELANYYWTICQYYRALTLDPGSPPQIEALKTAEIDLDAYISEHDGQLLAVFAQDVLGQALAERAKHAGAAGNAEEQQQLVTKALGWFQTCIDETYTDADTLTVITNGYQHYAQTCLEAGRIGTRNFLREGVEVLEKMLERVPHAGKTSGGIRALILYGELELALGNTDSAVNIFRDASDRAKQAALPALEGEANKKVGEAVRGGSTVSNVGVLRMVAEDSFAHQRYEEAIRTFQGVIAGAPATPQGFLEYAWPAWDRIGQCYRELGDLLSSAMAYEAIHEAWVDGRIPTKKGDENDANMRKAGTHRKRGIAALEELATRTRSKVFQEAAKQAERAFATEYPDDPSAKDKELRLAIEKVKAGRDARTAKQPGWRALYEEGRAIFAAQSKNILSQHQDAAYAWLVKIDYALSDATPEGKAAAERGLKTADEARAFWASEAGKQKLNDYPGLQARRQEAELDVRSTRGDLLKVLERWDALLDEMGRLRKDVGEGERGDDAQALIVEAHIRKGDVKAADDALSVLLKRGRHKDIPALVSQIANRFDDKFRELTKQFNATNEELNGTSEDRSTGVAAQLRAAENRYNDVLSIRVSLHQKLDTIVRDIAAWRKDPLLVKGLTEKAVKEYEAVTIPDLQKEIATAETEIPALEKKMAGLRTRAEALQLALKTISAEQYEPLKEAVIRFHRGMDSQQANDPASVKHGDLLMIAARWYAAARNTKGTDEDWAMARLRLEQYLAHAAVKALPESDPGKRSAVTKLGRVYSRLAARETDPAKRSGLVQQAIVLLETSLASRPENNGLVLGLLTRQYGAVAWENPLEQGPVTRFIVPRAADAATLRAAIAKLGAPDSPVPLPAQPDPGRQAAYRKALTAWKEHIAQLTPSAFEAFFKDVQGSGLDAATFREYGNTNLEFRLSLGAAYTESGNDADLEKGEVILATMLRSGPISVEAFSGDYWEAATLALKLWINHAERLSAAGGVPARASELRKRARQFFQSQTAVASVPAENGVRDAWKALLERLNKGLRTEGAPDVTVDLDKVQAPDPVNPPAPAAPPAPAQPAAPEGPEGGSK